jgi:hypothetical protein
LYGLNARVRRGEIVGICGRVASGKSSLLQGILGPPTPLSSSPRPPAGSRARPPPSWHAWDAHEQQPYPHVLRRSRWTGCSRLREPTQLSAHAHRHAHTGHTRVPPFCLRTIESCAQAKCDKRAAVCRTRRSRWRSCRSAHGS